MGELLQQPVILKKELQESKKSPIPAYSTLFKELMEQIRYERTDEQFIEESQASHTSALNKF